MTIGIAFTVTKSVAIETSMPPDLYFALTLVLKMAITAGFVLTATIAAERAGPLIGGLVATLPIGAGPVYVFLALDHDAHFIAQSAVASLAVNAINVIFAVTYCVLAQKRSLGVSLGGTYVVWTLLALLATAKEWSFFPALLVNAAVIAVALYIVQPYRHEPMPRQYPRWHGFVLRALMVAALVGIVVAFSFRIGSYGSGLLAVFPVVLTSIILIFHRRAGGKPTAAVLANAPVGLLGFGIACSVLHFTAEPLGVVAGLSLALATSVGWSLAVITARRHGLAV
ncbi:MAG TPA: hypothetical protein VJR71_03265 [Pseudolabrys sp.]|nr:hypothetical protein [Pseudolabrys sp.]